MVAKLRSQRPWQHARVGVGGRTTNVRVESQGAQNVEWVGLCYCPPGQGVLGRAMGWRSPPPAPSLFTTAKGEGPEDALSPGDPTARKRGLKAKTLSTITRRCHLSFVTSATCLFSGDSTWTFT